MNILQFLDDKKVVSFATASVVCFQGEKEYPLLFFSYVWRSLSTRLSYGIRHVSAVDHEYDTIVAQLETSFLGQRQLYWFGNVSGLPDKKRAALIAYLQQYKGPNQVAFFIDESQTYTAEHAQIIVIPDYADKKTCITLLNLFELKLLSSYKQFIDQLFALYRRVKLEAACLLLQYMIRGAQGDLFFASWVPALVDADTSLFTLSQDLFAKDSVAFARQWHRVKDLFPDVFWTTFWSEQIWRAYQYRYLSSKKQFAQAKRIGYRLPFSFMQRDWRSWTCPQLRAAHAALYELDYRLKNSEGTIGLDLFLSRLIVDGFGEV